MRDHPFYASIDWMLYDNPIEEEKDAVEKKKEDHSEEGASSGEKNAMTDEVSSQPVIVNEEVRSSAINEMREGIDE